MMIHECKVQCHSLDVKTAELTGQEDDGKWLPFIFNMDVIDAAKLTSDDIDSNVKGCTTVFTTRGDTFIIDTPYEKFFKKFSEYNALQIIIQEEDENDDDGDLEL